MMEICEAENTCRPLMSFHPDIITVFPYKVAPDAFPIWPVPTARGRKKRLPKRRHDGSIVEVPGPEVASTPIIHDTVPVADGDVQLDEQSLSGDAASEVDLEGELQDEIDGLLSRVELNLEPLSMESLEPKIYNVEEELAIVAAEQSAPGGENMGEALVAATPGPIVLQEQQEIDTMDVGQPLVPQAAVAPKRVARGPTSSAQCVVVLAHGTIAYYVKGDFFEAVCRNPAHGTCRNASGTLIKSGWSGGRPLGMLCMWLSESQKHDTKALHWDKETWKLWSQADREAQRLELAQLPNGMELLACERPRQEGEPIEAETLQGYLR